MLVYWFHMFFQPGTINTLKKYYTSRDPSSGRSVQWIAFCTLSFPYLALIVEGYNALAIAGSWGPHSSLNLLTTSFYLISKAIQVPVVIWSAIYDYSAKTF